jgi:hypothetical protein
MTGTTELMDHLEFPVLSIAANGFLSSTKDQTSLETCTKWALRKHYFDGLLLIDATGRMFQVQRANERRSAPLWRRLFGRYATVDLQMEPTGHIGLQQLQDRACEAMQRLPEQWEAVEGVEAAQGRVQAARSIREVNEMFLDQ